MTRPLRVLSAIGDVTRIFTVTLVLPIVAAFVYEPYDVHLGPLALPRNLFVFLLTALALTAFWVPVHYWTQDLRDEDLREKEAYLTVGLGWIIITLFGMLPFLFSGVLRNPVDAFFETMSGLTTTGATVLPGVLEDVPRSVMLWRAELQYIGGMGIIVLSVALLARLTQGGMQLLQAEAPGPSVTRLRPKLAHTARTLWLVYAAMSAMLAGALFLILLGRDMSVLDALYDSVLHTFTAMSTGGFSNHTASIGFYDSWLVEATLILFMLVAGGNFTLHYYVLHGDAKKLLRDPEWRFFITSFVLVTLVTTGMLWNTGQSLWQAFRGASFTIASIGTSTGFGTVDFDQWPDFGKTLLILLMITGGTAGSTAGGVKFVRVLLLLKIVRRQIRLLLHPRAVIPVRLGGRVIKEETLMTVVAFFFAFISITLFGSLLVMATDPLIQDPVDGISAGASMIGNTGPALGVLGPTHGYWGLLPTSKMVFSAMMWFGRLEVFAALLLFSPSSWRN